MGISRRRGIAVLPRFLGKKASSRFTPAPASHTPRAPPAVATSRLSASDSRTSRQVLAPSATRTAASRSRPDARTSSRLATLAQAISSTNATAAARIFSAGRMPPTVRSSIGSASAVQPEWVSGWSRSIRAATRFSAASASSRVTPGLSRPATRRNRRSRLSASAGSSASGVHSCRVPNAVLVGITPITV